MMQLTMRWNLILGISLSAGLMACDSLRQQDRLAFTMQQDTNPLIGDDRVAGSTVPVPDVRSPLPIEPGFAFGSGEGPVAAMLLDISPLVGDAATETEELDRQPSAIPEEPKS